MGPTGNEQKGNPTDPESAKMSSSRGVLQGYNGLAVVDDRAQIVVHAEAHGSGYEAHLLAPLIEATRETFGALAPGKDVFKSTKVTADSGFHSKVVVAEVEKTGADAYIADRDYRRRDPAFATAERHKEPDKKERALKRKRAREQEAREPSKRRPVTPQPGYVSAAAVNIYQTPRRSFQTQEQSEGSSRGAHKGEHAVAAVYHCAQY